MLIWLWYKIVRVLGYVLSATIGPWRVYGLENIPRKGPVILAANHQSYLDPLLMGWKAPRYLYAMGKKELFEIPFLGKILPHIGSFPVDHSSPRSAIKAAMEVLNRGDGVVIFPEGTRTRGPIGKAQPGVALLARKSNAPIVPVLITGAHIALSPDHAGLARGRMTITFGKPFQLGSEKVSLEEDAQHIMDAIAALRSETPDAAPPVREEDLPPPRVKRSSKRSPVQND